MPSESKSTFHIVGNDSKICTMMLNHGYYYEPLINSADCVIFTGGEDICPVLYGEVPLDRTHYNIKRDMEEIKIYKSLPWATNKIGICRGAQFLHVMAGGSLWQDVDNHLGDHLIQVIGKDKSVMTINVSSTHHQMMRDNIDCNVIARGGKSKVKKADGAEFKDITPWSDLEIVYNWTNNSLCFQPHPEYGPKSCTDLFFKLIRETFYPEKKDS